MTPERWQQVKRILEGVLECDAAVRDEWLKSACAGDDSLRRDVESLLMHATEGDLRRGLS